MSYDDDDAQASLDDWMDDIYAANARRDRIEVAGLDALPVLIEAASSDTGQSEVCKQFLLGLFDGRSFPFNLNSLRGLDHQLRDAAMSALDMDTFNTTCEIHERLEGTALLFRRWAMDEHARRIQASEE